MKNKNKLIIALIVVFALIFLAVAGYIVFRIINSVAADNEYNELASSYASDINIVSGTDDQQATTAESRDKPESNIAPTVKNPVNVPELEEENKDIYAWINIPNTNVNYPVAQSDADDNFYLDHDIHKNYSFPGTIYSQSCNKKDFSDRVTVLYGHNMLDGSMFATLHNFSDPDFFANNKYMYIYTENRKLTYEVVSAYIYDDRHIMNSFNFNDDKVYAEWQQEALNPRSVSSNVRKDVKLTTDDKMLVLSTCLNGGGDGRYLVQGVLIKDEQAG